MKKFLLVLIALGTTFSLTGCFGDEEEVVVPKEEEGIKEVVPIIENLGIVIEGDILKLKYKINDPEGRINELTYAIKGSGITYDHRYDIPQLFEHDMTYEIVEENLMTGVSYTLQLSAYYDTNDGRTNSWISMEDENNNMYHRCYIPKEEYKLNGDFTVDEINRTSVLIWAPRITDNERCGGDYCRTIKSATAKITNKETGEVTEQYFNNVPESTRIEIIDLEVFTNYKINIYFISNLDANSLNTEDRVEELFEVELTTSNGPPIMGENTSDIEPYEVVVDDLGKGELPYSFTDKSGTLFIEGIDYNLFELASDGTQTDTRATAMDILEDDIYPGDKTVIMRGLEKGKTYRLQVIVWYAYVDYDTNFSAVGDKYIFKTV